MTYERTRATDWVWLTSYMFTSEMYMYVDRKSIGSHCCYIVCLIHAAAPRLINGCYGHDVVYV